MDVVADERDSEQFFILFVYTLPMNAVIRKEKEKKGSERERESVQGENASQNQS